jgi:hypothetical protein
MIFVASSDMAFDLTELRLLRPCSACKTVPVLTLQNRPLYIAVMKTLTTTIIALMTVSAFNTTTARADQPHMRRALAHSRA